MFFNGIPFTIGRWCIILRCNTASWQANEKKRIRTSEASEDLFNKYICLIMNTQNGKNINGLKDIYIISV